MSIQLFHGRGPQQKSRPVRGMHVEKQVYT